MKKFVTLISLVIAVSITATPVYAKKGEETVKIGRMALVLCHSPALLFDKKEFLEKNGVDNYELKFFTKGSQSALALGAGETDMAFFGAIIPAIANGLDAKIIATNSTGGVQLVCQDPGIKSLKDLQGKSVGNIGPTSAPTSIFNLALEEAGIDRDTITHQSINRRNIVLALAEKKIIDCAVLVEPLTSEAVKRGASLALDEKQLYNNGDYPFTFVVAKDKYIKSNHDTIERVLKTHKDSQDFLTNNHDKSVKLLVQYFHENGVDSSHLEISRGLATNGFSQKISRSVMENLVRVLHKSGIIDKKIAFEDLVDCSFGLCTE